ncbi:hypothetical protein CAG99_25850 [Streptomyces marincola]|uniref:Uncharacterized protein n=1 Tax=Streptomyces marincola TaxID=2878388 RepID=A0A1W7D4E9_9ACTN|nr:hypothetical protein CAG99_25850 [Streptomyces marincola]
MSTRARPAARSGGAPARRAAAALAPRRVVPGRLWNGHQVRTLVRGHRTTRHIRTARQEDRP